MNAVMAEASVGGLTVSPAWRCGLHIPPTLLLTLQLMATKSSHVSIRVLLSFLPFLPRGAHSVNLDELISPLDSSPLQQDQQQHRVAFPELI